MVSVPFFKLLNIFGILIGSALAIGVSSTSCTHPSVRKEWRTMTNDQKAAWIGAVNCLGRLPNSGKLQPTVNNTGFIPPVNKTGSWYDDLVYVHIDLNTHIHNTGFFFPWHRYYLWSFEQSLKNLCGYKGVSPYWDWSIDAPDFEHASILQDSDRESGLGGFGDPARDHTVTDGGFAKLTLAYPSPHNLRREYTPYPFLNFSPPLFTNPNVSAASTFTRSEVDKMVRSFKGDFKSFQTYFEQPEGAHSGFHLIMGGDLAGKCLSTSPSNCVQGRQWTPNEPMVWLAHAMVDKIWYDWQHAHPQNFWAFEAGTVQDFASWPKFPVGAPPPMTTDFKLPTDGILIGDHTVHDMLDTTSGGPLCYVYR